jgi:hypothetical protein
MKVTESQPIKYKAMKSKHLHSVLIIVLISLTLQAASQPVIGGYNVYYGSLHNHSNVSDGQGTPSQAYNYAKNTAHLDFFGLADHSNMITSTEWTTIKNTANSFNQDGVFAAFYGFEWTTFLSYGHVAVINTDDYCSNSGSTSTFSGLLNWINARNGIAFFNHPGWESTAFMEFNHFTDTPSEKFVGIELWNDHDGFSEYYYNDGYYSNDGNKGYYDEALVRGWKIGAAGSDDNHTATWGTATPFRVGVLANTLSRTEILSAFNARRFFSTLDNNISLSFKVNGAEMGSTVPGGTWNAVIMANDADNEVFTQVVMMKNGSMLYTWTPNQAQPVISQNITCNNGDYFYVRVKQTDGGEAISSPIYISGAANQPPEVAITTPANGAVFNLGQTIVIAATATDTDGTISKVEFYQGTTLLGEDNSTPYQYSWAGAAAGNYTLTAKAFDNLGATTLSAAISILVVQQTSYTIQSLISSGIDDAEEYKNGNVSLTGDDLELVYDTKTTGNQTVGLLFRNLNIPQGASITKAYIQFTVDEKTTNSCSLTVKGEASDNAADFSTTAYNISNRTRTQAGVSWTPSAWRVVGSSGTAQQTPDLKSIIQEIVNRSGWTTSSKLAIIFNGTGTRTAESFEGSQVASPYIHVEYTTASTKSVVATFANQSIAPGQAKTDLGILVYPNPVSDILTVRVSDEIRVERIFIYSMTGCLINEFDNAGNQAEIQINCTSLIPGIYLLDIQGKWGRQTVRFVKNQGK